MLMEEGYCDRWQHDLLFDDQMWYQAMVSSRYLEAHHRGRHRDDPHGQHFYWLLRRGIVNPSLEDRCNEFTVRSLRYSAIIGERLWAMIEGERARVSLHATPFDGVT